MTRGEAGPREARERLAAGNRRGTRRRKRLVFIAYRDSMRGTRRRDIERETLLPRASWTGGSIVVLVGKGRRMQLKSALVFPFGRCSALAEAPKPRRDGPERRPCRLFAGRVSWLAPSLAPPRPPPPHLPPPPRSPPLLLVLFLLTLGRALSLAVGAELLLLMCTRPTHALSWQVSRRTLE